MVGAEDGGDPDRARPTAATSVSGLANLSYKAARRIAVAIVGATLGLVGVILIFTPGPAFVVLTLALAVLSVEFAWARRWLRRLQDVAKETVGRVGGDRRSARAAAPGDATGPAPQSVRDAGSGRPDFPDER